MSLPASPFAVLTGASSGIGAALARALAAPGGTLVLAGRDRLRLAAVAADVRAAGATALTVKGSLDDDRHLDAILAEAASAGPAGLDLLVHAAAEFSWAILDDLDLADFDRTLRVNLRAPLVLTRGLGSRLVETAGQVVFVNSSIVERPKAGTAAYSAAKHGLRGLAAVVREEMNPRGVRVLSAFPGSTATPMQDAVARALGPSHRTGSLLRPEDVARSILGALRLPRTAETTDLHLRPTAPSEAWA